MKRRNRSKAASEERRERLLPGGIPRHVRIYDNGGGSLDRYTVVFTGRIPGKLPGWTFYLAMGEHVGTGFGVCLHGETFGPVDRPRYGHLGRKIPFEELPEGCRKMVLGDYRDLWELGEADPEEKAKSAEESADESAEVAA